MVQIDAISVPLAHQKFRNLLLLGMVVNGQIEVSMCDTLAANVTKCKTDHPATGTTALTRQQIMGFYKLSTDVSCADNFSDLLACVVTAYRNCGDENSIALVAEPAEYQTAVKKICDNKIDYDETCITAAYDTCSTTAPANLTAPTTPSDVEGLKDYYCGMFGVAIDCTDTSADLTDCAKSKTKMILKEILTGFKPQACTDGTTDGTSVGTTTTILATSLLVASLVSSMFF